MKNRKPFYLFAVGAGLALNLLFITCASGSSAPVEKEYRTTQDGVGALTPKMIKNCISMKKQLDELAEEATVAKEQLGKIDADLKASEEELLEEEKTLDKTDNEAIAEYNFRVKAYKERLAEYQLKTEKYNAQIKPYATLEKKYKRLCGNQSYYEDDYAQAKEEMGYGLE